MQGTKAHGWHNQLWTADRVARLVRATLPCFVTYPEHIRKILKRRLGWTSRKPKRKARERNDKEVERWKADALPRIRRDAWKRQAHARLPRRIRGLPADAFGASHLGALAGGRRCWVLGPARPSSRPLAALPLVPVKAAPELYFQLLPLNKTAHAEDTVAFLKELRRQLRGPFTVVWDRAQHPRQVAGGAGVLGQASGDRRGKLPWLCTGPEPRRVRCGVGRNTGRLSNLAAVKRRGIGGIYVVEALIMT